MNFRLIPFRFFNAAMNMALDETIMQGIRTGQAPPTIRFYGWDPSAISLGYFQGLKYEVNEEACQRAGVDVVRRITGGGAVFHDRDGEVTYSIMGPLGIFPPNVIESYQLICADIIGALGSLGIQAAFAPINDIVVGERKISGNAQTRRKGIFLQHGTILYTVDVEKMFSLLNVSEQKIADKLIRSVKKRVTCVREWKAIDRSELISALEKAFSANRQVEAGDYTESELEGAKQLAEEKYSSRAWIAMR